MKVGDVITVRRMYPMKNEYVTGTVVKVLPHGEVWVSLPGFEGSIIVRPRYGYYS